MYYTTAIFVCVYIVDVSALIVCNETPISANPDCSGSLFP